MTTYAIGDVQGCFAGLEKLLRHIRFEPACDSLWFTGDLVNRGPQSLEVLRFVKSLGDQHVTVLGNHDLYLLALFYAEKTRQVQDTLHDVLAAPDVEELMTWLIKRPLLHYEQGYVMTHAGLAPAWTLETAQQLALEVESLLRNSPSVILSTMYGNMPDRWDEQLQGVDRWRCILNYFTRMRFCAADGRLLFGYDGDLLHAPAELIPWFNVAPRMNAHHKIIFGHWAALAGKTDVAGIYALDTGCVWGGCLTAMRLDDERRFSIQCY